MFPAQIPQLSMQQLQYQNQLTNGRGAPQMNGFGYPNMQSGFGGYSNPSPSVDHYRNQGMNASPIQQPQQMSAGQMPFGAPPGFGMGIGGYGYGMNGMGAVGQMQGMGVGGGYMQQEQQGRRGRR